MATEIVDWGSIGGQSGDQKGGGGSNKFIKFSSGTGVVVRPIGKAVTFYKFFVKTPQGNRSIVVDPEYKNEAAAKLSAHAGEEIKPSLRYAINVIDRNDQQIRILEGGKTIFEHFANWSSGNGGIAPGGESGADWMITPTGDGMQRKYATTALKPAPLTQEEVTRIKENKEYYSLKEVFASCPLEEVVDRIFGDRNASGPEPAAPAQQQTASAPVAASASTDDPALW